MRRYKLNRGPWRFGAAIRMRKNTLRRSGAELLELGLVLGAILLPIMFGTIEFGTYFYVEHNLQSAAREAARAACVYAYQDPNAYTAATLASQQVIQQSSLSGWPNFQGLTPTLQWAPDPLHTNPQQYYVQITLAVTWDKIPSGMRPMRMITSPQNVTLKGFASMRVEQ